MAAPVVGGGGGIGFTRGEPSMMPAGAVVELERGSQHRRDHQCNHGAC